MKIEQGVILEVKNDFVANPTSCHIIGDRKVIIEKGEKIEIRYPYAWHFRTIDDYYFQADEDVLMENCVYLGEIWEKVRFSNLAKLQQILDLKLFKDNN